MPEPVSLTENITEQSSILYPLVVLTTLLLVKIKGKYSIVFFVLQDQSP